MEKRILILYITHLSGHHKAAKAIERSLLLLDKDCRIFSFDAFAHLHSRSSRVINFLYSFVIRRASFIWRGIYDKKSVIRFLSPIKHMVHVSNLSKIHRLIQEIKPQAVVCTQAFPCGVMAAYKKRRDYDFSLFGVVTDFWPHGFWFYREVDHYIVASDWCQHRFEAAKIPSKRIKPFGIPVMPEFVQTSSKEEAAKEISLDPSRAGVLVMGGGSGLGPLKDIALKLDKSPVDFQPIVVCGKNKQLYDWFLSQRFQKPFKILAYTEQVPRLMDFCDIIITKPGGITISESLTRGLAIIVLNPIPGQEENNLRFLAREGLAIKAPDPAGVAGIVEDLLTDKEKLKAIRQRGLDFARPSSAQDIAGLILKSIK